MLNGSLGSPISDVLPIDADVYARLRGGCQERAVGEGVARCHPATARTARRFSAIVTLRCSVDAVHFKDGSEWSPAAAAASATRATSELSGDGWIGVQMDQTPQGVVAHLVIPDGPARAAGMMQGDIIQKVDDQHVTTVTDALILISSVKPGAQLKITVLRGDGQHDFLVVVGRRPQ